MKKEGDVSNYCSRTFKILDMWLNEVTKENGEGALRTVKDALHNNVEANVSHYETLAREAQNVGQSELAAQYKVLAKVYKGLLD